MAELTAATLGKDLGASRAVELLAAQDITPQAWRTVGDSRTDYAMADWLHANGHEVAHVDVRPSDGVPATPYPVLTAGDGLHLKAKLETLLYPVAKNSAITGWSSFFPSS